MKAVIPVRGEGDQKLAEAAVEIYWLTVTSTAANATLILRNGPTAESPVLFNSATLASLSYHWVFQPPMLFTHGLYIDPDSSVESWVLSFGPYIEGKEQ